MFRHAYALAAMVCGLFASAAIGSSPTLTLPSQITGTPGAFIPVPATTAGKTVKWCVLDPGLNLFPAELLKDTRTAVVTSSKAGSYRLLAVTAAEDEPSTPVICTVIIAAPSEPAKPPAEPTKPPATSLSQGAFLFEGPSACGPNGCPLVVPSTITERRFRR